MPYKSEAQRRWAHTKRGVKALGGKEKADEWDKESKGKKLPERVEDNMKVIKKKNGYTLAITNQGYGERIILMFPGETEKNPHMWLGLPTSENMKKAIETFEAFAKIKSKDSVLLGVLKTIDAVEERIINKPETDANGIVADKRMFVKLYEDFKRERDPQNKVIIAKEMKKTLERIKKNSESDFDEEDVRQFSRVLEIVNRKAF